MTTKFRKFAAFLMLLTLIPMLTFANDPDKKPPVKKYDLKDFFRNPEKSSFQLSPDGEHVSFMAPYESRMNVFVRKRGSDKAQRITDVTDRDIAGYMWANDNRILYLKDNGGDENFALFGVNLDEKGTSKNNHVVLHGRSCGDCPVHWRCSRA